MHGVKGKGRPHSKSINGGGLLTVACPDDEMSHQKKWKKLDGETNSSYNSFNSFNNLNDPRNYSYHSSSAYWPWESRRARSRALDDESLFSAKLPPTHYSHHQHHPHHRDHLPSSSSYAHYGKRPTSSSNNCPTGHKGKLIYKCFQVFSFLIIGVSLYALVENIKYLIQTYDNDGGGGEGIIASSSIRRDEEIGDVVGGSHFVNINEELKSWIIHDKLDTATSSKTTESLITTNSLQSSTSSSSSSSHLNVANFSFVLNNASICDVKNGSKRKVERKIDVLGDGVYFMIVVHSAPDHFEARQAIRSTWGSVKFLKKVAFRVVFLLGKTSDSVEDHDLVESSIARESQIFGDIVTSTFVDSYKNLTYKHLLAYKWALEFCPGAAFILKADDDAFIDMFQLFDFITRTYGFSPPSGTLICNVFPEGSKPVRSSDAMGGKWAVSADEYSHSSYPKYCGGLMYLITPDAAKKILSLSTRAKFFWIDDVYITGILRELANIEPFYLNLRYSYEPEQYRRWLNLNNSSISIKSSGGSNNNSGSSRGAGKNGNVINVHSKLSKFPFMITHVERGAKFSEEMNRLWRKTLRVWSEDYGAIIIRNK